MTATGDYVPEKPASHERARQRGQREGYHAAMDDYERYKMEKEERERHESERLKLAQAQADAYERYQYEREKDAELRRAAVERDRMMRPSPEPVPGHMHEMPGEYPLRHGYPERREQMPPLREYGGRMEERMGPRYRPEEVLPMRYPPVHDGYGAGEMRRPRSVFGSDAGRMVPRDRYRDDPRGMAPMHRRPASRGFGDHQHGGRYYGRDSFEGRGMNEGHHLVRRGGGRERPRAYSDLYEERLRPGRRGYSQSVGRGSPAPRSRGYRSPPRRLGGW